MQAAQQSLGAAERHHEKAVKKTRKEAEADFQKEGLIAGQAVRDYAEDLQKTNDELEKSVLAAQQAVADSNAAEAKLISWNSPGMSERAHLGALASSAEHDVKKAMRWRKQMVKEAEERVGSPFEDDTTKLSRKLGDLSSFIEEVRTSVSNEVQQVLDAPEPATKKVVNSTVMKSPEKATADMKKAESKLKEARNSNANATKVAEKRLDTALMQMEKRLKIDVEKMIKEVDVAQEQEIKKVRNMPTVAPPKAKAKAVKATQKDLPKASHEKKAVVSAPKVAVKSTKPVVTSKKGGSK